MQKVLKCYGYTRDKRSFGSKNLNAHLCNGKVTDEFENCEMYQKLPFSPTIIGSTKIIEGDFDDCLKMIICDKEEEIKLQTEEKLAREASRKKYWYRCEKKIKRLLSIFPGLSAIRKMQKKSLNTKSRFVENMDLQQLHRQIWQKV